MIQLLSYKIQSFLWLFFIGNTFWTLPWFQPIGS